MSNVQFNLEQKILDCWGITDDLNDLNEGVIELGLTSDQISNTIEGIRSLYELKFQKCFELFEQYTKEKYNVT